MAARKRRLPAIVDPADDLDDPSKAAETRCWLCERALGEQVEWHHPVPKSRKGRVTVPVHPICHRTIHANFDNKELARIGHDRDRLARDERLAGFLEWIAGKPPDFHVRTRTTQAKRDRLNDRRRRR